MELIKKEGKDLLFTKYGFFISKIDNIYTINIFDEQIKFSNISGVNQFFKSDIFINNLLNKIDDLDFNTKKPFNKENSELKEKIKILESFISNNKKIKKKWLKHLKKG